MFTDRKSFNLQKSGCGRKVVVEERRVTRVGKVELETRCLLIVNRSTFGSGCGGGGAQSSKSGESNLRQVWQYGIMIVWWQQQKHKTLKYFGEKDWNRPSSSFRFQRMSKANSVFCPQKLSKEKEHQSSFQKGLKERNRLCWQRNYLFVIPPEMGGQDTTL